jgi:hypothetical protein
MGNIGHLIFLFGFKMMDNLLGTTKTLLVQRNRAILAGLALGLSNFIYMYITKDIVTSDNTLSLVIVSIASGLGCALAVKLGNHFSKDKTYVNVILSDDIEAMKQLRDFLADNKITNVAGDSYTLDWSKKTLSITAYAETRDQSKLIDDYIESNDAKFKRLVQNKRVK